MRTMFGKLTANTMNDTPTPETDGKAYVSVKMTADGPRDGPLVVPADFARKLERERDELAACLASEKITRNHIVERAAKTERELAELKQSITNLSHPNCHMLLRERDEAREQRDTMAETLKFILADKIANAADMRYRANKALATLKKTL
jgi:hypothetical protein